MDQIKSKQGIKLNGKLDGTNQNEEETWKREGKEVTHSYENPITKKRKNTQIYSYCRAVNEVPYKCCTHGKATATVTASTEREEEGTVWYYYYSYVSHWTIHYSSHPTHYNDSDMTSVYQVIQVISTNMIPSCRTINRITQLIVYAWNNSVVIIHVGMNGHGHYNIHIISSIPIPNPFLSFHCKYQHHHL